MPRSRGSYQTKRPIEYYDHRDKERLNNPPVGMVTPETDQDAGRRRYAYDPHLDPQLQWAGKAEHTSFEVPTVSLHVHERIDPRTIIEATRKRNGDGTPVQASLFELPEENPPVRNAIEFYQHRHNWTNRLVAGDSQRQRTWPRQRKAAHRGVLRARPRPLGAATGEPSPPRSPDPRPPAQGYCLRRLPARPRSRQRISTRPTGPA